jgi:hypothetical protein
MMKFKKEKKNILKKSFHTQTVTYYKQTGYDQSLDTNQLKEYYINKNLKLLLSNPHTQSLQILILTQQM